MRKALAFMLIGFALSTLLSGCRGRAARDQVYSPESHYRNVGEIPVGQ